MDSSQAAAGSSGNSWIHQSSARATMPPNRQALEGPRMRTKTIFKRPSTLRSCWSQRVTLPSTGMVVCLMMPAIKASTLEYCSHPPKSARDQGKPHPRSLIVQRNASGESHSRETICCSSGGKGKAWEGFDAHQNMVCLRFALASVLLNLRKARSIYKLC